MRGFKPQVRAPDTEGPSLVFSASSEAEPLKFPSSRASSRASSTRSVVSNSNGHSTNNDQRRDSVGSQISNVSFSGHDHKRGSWSSASSNSSDVSMNFGTAEDYYFCPVPEDFVFSHFPFESKWQLLQANDCLTKRSFEKLAVIRDEFFMMVCLKLFIGFGAH